MKMIEHWLSEPVRKDVFVAQREMAGVRSRELGFPDRSWDAWRLADFSGLWKGEFAALPPPADFPDISENILPETFRVVFVDGHYSAGLSLLPDDGELVVSFPGQGSALQYAGLGRGLDNDVFSQLNTRNFTDCAFIEVRGVVGKPLHVLFVTTHHEMPTVSYARCCVVMHAYSKALLIEEYVALGHQGLTNALTDIRLGEHATLRHIHVSATGDTSLHLGNTEVRLPKEAQYDATLLSLGGRLARDYLRVIFEGEGAEVCLDGLVLADAQQVLGVYTRIDHQAPSCRSVQRQKCIAGGKATVIFSGNIVVHEGASGTDSRQECRNLLLSGEARIDAQPQLEIGNQDVSCKHGTTVGRLDEEEIFYLRSRGLDADVARHVLVYAFASEIVSRIPVASLVARLEKKLMEKLS